MQPTVSEARQFLCWASKRLNVPVRKTAEVMKISKSKVTRDAKKGKLVADVFLSQINAQIIPHRVPVENIENYSKDRDIFS